MIPWSWISCYTKVPIFPKQTCIACSQSNPCNIFHSVAVNTFSGCHFFIFPNAFCKYSVSIRKFCSVKTSVSYVMADITTCITRRRVGRPKLPGSLKSIRLRESVLNLWRDRKEALGFSECTDSEFAEFLLHRRRWGLLLDNYNTICHIKFILLSCSCRYVSPVCIRSWFPSFPFQIKHHSWISRSKFISVL